MSLINIEKINNKTYYLFLIIIAAFIPIFLGLGKYELVVFLVLFPVLILLAFVFDKYYRIIFVISLFIGFYIHVNARIQVVNLVSYALIIYFILNFRTHLFNRFKIPLFLRLISILLVIAVFVSAINTPFISKWSLYYAFMFLVYIFTGFIIFKSILSIENVGEYLDYFYKTVSIYGIFIILQIIITGNIRSFGISGPTISDIIAMSLLIVVFKSYISGKVSSFNFIHSLILIIVLITTLSRFSWIGFASTFVYGIALVSITQTKILFSKRSLYVLGGSLLILVIVVGTGLHRLILDRFLDVNFTVLDTTSEEGAISNSLDTRALIWVTAFNAFADNLFSGVGYFMFHKVSYAYNSLPEELYIDFVMGLDPHSTFLGFLTETGLFGFVTFFVYLISTFVLSIKSIRISFSNEAKSISLILSILMFFMISTSFYSGAFTFGYNAYILHTIVWITLANYLINRNISLKNEKNYTTTHQ